MHGIAEIDVSEADANVIIDDKDLYYYEIDGLPEQSSADEDIFEPHLPTRVSFSTNPIQVSLVGTFGASASLSCDRKKNNLNIKCTGQLVF